MPLPAIQPRIQHIVHSIELAHFCCQRHASHTLVVQLFKQYECFKSIFIPLECCAVYASLNSIHFSLCCFLNLSMHLCMCVYARASDRQTINTFSSNTWDTLLLLEHCDASSPFSASSSPAQTFHYVTMFNCSPDYCL